MSPPAKTAPLVTAKPVPQDTSSIVIVERKPPVPPPADGKVAGGYFDNGPTKAIVLIIPIAVLSLGISIITHQAYALCFGETLAATFIMAEHLNKHKK